MTTDTSGVDAPAPAPAAHRVGPAAVEHGASRRFLAESRRRVRHNAEVLHRGRRAGPDAHRRRLADLEVLSAATVADLLAPGPVRLRLAVAGFGVTLPPP